MRRIALLLSLLATLGSLIACSGGEELTGLDGASGQPALLDEGTDPSSNN